MGRSGTSAVAGLFVASGYFAGAPDDLLPASSANPGGYYENLSTVVLNERILTELGASWFDPPPPELLLAQRERWLPELRTTFEKLLAGAACAPVALKDPRLGVLLDLWDPVIGELLHPVLVVRHPLEVAMSLRSRDGTPPPFGLAAWELNMGRTLAWLASRRVTVAQYAEILASPQTAEQLVRAATDNLDPTRMRQVQPTTGEGWLDGAMRHNRAEQTPFTASLTTRQQALWSWLEELPAGTTVLDPPASLLEVPALVKEAVSCETERQERTRAFEHLHERVTHLEDVAGDRDWRLSFAEQKSRALERDLVIAQAEQRKLAELHRRNSELLNVLVGSRSWRLTAAARDAARLMRDTMAVPVRPRPKAPSGETPAARGLPIFVISYNRPDSLRVVLDSYRQLGDQIELIIHDNGSDTPQALQYLDELRRSGTTVVNSGPIHLPDDLNRVNQTIHDYFGGPPATRYVVTDCDIDLSITDPRALAIYSELLDRFPDAACVGPMLRIRDIDARYPLLHWALNRHIEFFWSQEPEWTETSAGRTAFLRCPIDTTFALHREHQPFHRLEHGIRVYFPFEARHLDWYPDEMGRRDEGYVATSAPDISHWNNATQRAIHSRERPCFDHFVYVDSGASGELEVARFELRGPDIDTDLPDPSEDRGAASPEV